MSPASDNDIVTDTPGRPLHGAAWRERAVPGIAEVYEAHFAYVQRALRHLGVREPQLDDAAQDVFLVVHAKLPAFDGRVALTTWLYAIVILVARRYRERQGRARRFDSDERLSSESATERDLDARRRLELARRALDALDAPKREVFVLAEIEQMPAPEIAAATGTPLNTVYSRLRAARLAFASAVRKLELGKGSAP